MALNKFMHPRNHYKDNRPDFARLGEKYPEFHQFLTFSDKGKPTLDFKDPEALRALTCTLLREDFDIDLDVPLDHIIPTVPLRLNYIHWLEDLLEGMPKNGQIWGIDIGCGTSCIYPLLGAKMNGWCFWALEVDPLALQYAKDNVERNKLGDNIQVMENHGESLFLDLLNSSAEKRFHFTMCNPPFFGNLLEAQGFLSSRGEGRAEPSSVSTADEVEMIVEGGEVEYVKRMIAESRMVQNRVLWFTSMLGKKTSVGRIIAELKKEKVPAWTTTEFCQGKTMRWGVAWSYQREAKKKHSPQKRRPKNKPPLSIPVPPAFIAKMFQKLDPSAAQKTGQSRGRQEKVLIVAMAMEQLMEGLQMSVTKQASTKWNPKYDLVAHKNTWSHQRRKRRQAKRKSSDQSCPSGGNATKEPTDSKVNTRFSGDGSRESANLGVNPRNVNAIPDVTPVKTFPDQHGDVPVAGAGGKIVLDSGSICQGPQSSVTPKRGLDGEVQVGVSRAGTSHCHNGGIDTGKPESSAFPSTAIAAGESNIEANNNRARIGVCYHGDTAMEIKRDTSFHRSEREPNSGGGILKQGSASDSNVDDEEKGQRRLSQKRTKLVEKSVDVKEGNSDELVGPRRKRIKLDRENILREGNYDAIDHSEHLSSGGNESKDAGVWRSRTLGEGNAEGVSGERRGVELGREHPLLTGKESKDDQTAGHLSLLAERERREGNGECVTFEDGDRSGQSAEPKRKKVELEGDDNLLGVGEASANSDNRQDGKSQSKTLNEENPVNLEVGSSGLKSDRSKDVDLKLGDTASTSGGWGKPAKHVHTAICMSSSDPGSGSDVEHCGPLLECVMEVKLVAKGAIVVVFASGPGQSKEVLHQVAQYVKNHIAREVKNVKGDFRRSVA